MHCVYSFGLNCTCNVAMSYHRDNKQRMPENNIKYGEWKRKRAKKEHFIALLLFEEQI